jgi:hypothetical protein
MCAFPNVANASWADVPPNSESRVRCGAVSGTLADRDVQCAVAVEVVHGECRVLEAAMLERVADKAAIGRLFEQD